VSRFLTLHRNYVVAYTVLLCFIACVMLY